ncbi:MAG: hypothetical protein IJF80_05520 [Clostridia bacterium]|nr:hypothetical protein [Clostridia bacterium]
MGELFLSILNMSLSASYVALAVFLLRLFFLRRSRRITFVLWAVLGIRLALPFSIESIFSLIPSAEVISPDIVYSHTPQVHSGIPALNHVVNPVIGESLAPQIGASVNPLQVYVAIISAVWAIGIAVMLVYALVSFLRLSKRVNTAVISEKGIYMSENIDSPFVLGIFKPTVYLPFNINDECKNYVLMHERAHIKHGDNIVKPIAFLLLALHWFNPLIWIAYILFCKDIEFACDERVIKTLENDERANYSEALLLCKAPSKKVKVCPLAFGETSIKSRVKNVLSYKKPALWIVVVSLVLCAVFALCFLTNPKGMKLYEINDAGTYITLFDNVRDVFVCGELADTDEVIDSLMKVEIAKSAIIKDRSEGRAKDIQIILSKDDGSEKTINFNQELSVVWIDNGVKPSLSYKILNPEVIKGVIEKYTKAKLTLADVIELSKRGKALSWADFEDFQYIETGSGLYIRQYKIDEMFTLSIGGGYTNVDPMYIYLSASDATDTFVDIRMGDVEAYINEHKDNVVAVNKSFSFQSCAVGYSEDIQHFMWSVTEKKQYFSFSSRMYLPYVAIRSKSELDEFIQSAKNVFNFDLRYEDTVSLNEAIREYDEEFFKAGNTLICAYTTAPTTSTRFVVSRARTIGSELFETTVQRVGGEMGDTAMEGWLTMIAVHDIRLSDYMAVYVYQE